MKPVLSCYQAAPLLEARVAGLTRARCSFDFGRSSVEVTLDAQGVRAEAVAALDWASVEQVAATDSVCFAIEEGGVVPLRIFSEVADRSFQLWPTPTSPALLVSGFLMHRVRDVAPDEGAARMVRALGKLHGRVLDTTSGLGYAAIAAARGATEVVSVELQPVVRELARQNPWSQALFEQPNIQLLDGDSSELVPTLAPESFAAVLHDPPAINLAGELYSTRFYAAVLRLLTRRGRFFHYIGDANSASGSRTTRGVIKRLREAGFSRVTPMNDAFGVLAHV
jgi:predicted methyltransferase